VDEQRALWRTWESTQDTLAPSPSVTGTMSIDIERAREALIRLCGVADAVSDQHRSLNTVVVTAPGTDRVSRNVAEQATRMIFAARAYLRSWHDDLVAGIRALEQQINDYESADGRNAARP
jgi:hypothetical protein